MTTPRPLSPSTLAVLGVERITFNWGLGLIRLSLRSLYANSRHPIGALANHRRFIGYPESAKLPAASTDSGGDFSRRLPLGLCLQFSKPGGRILHFRREVFKLLHLSDFDHLVV